MERITQPTEHVTPTLSDRTYIATRDAGSAILSSRPKCALRANFLRSALDLAHVAVPRATTLYTLVLRLSRHRSPAPRALPAFRRRRWDGRCGGHGCRVSGCLRPWTRARSDPWLCLMRTHMLQKTYTLLHGRRAQRRRLSRRHGAPPAHAAAGAAPNRWNSSAPASPRCTTTRRWSSA